MYRKRQEYDLASKDRGEGWRVLYVIRGYASSSAVYAYERNALELLAYIKALGGCSFAQIVRV